MHKRQFTSDAFKHTDYYNFIRHQEIESWKADGRNIILLNKLKNKYPMYDFDKYIEPTRKILQKTLNGIVQMYSDKEGYDFYNFINRNVLILASGRTDTPLYDANIKQFDFVMGDNLLCDSILKCAFSEAKGSLEILFSALEKLDKHDKTSKIIGEYKAKVCRKRLFSEMNSTVVSMAKKSREVPLNVHIFFRSTIGYDTINFKNNELKYNNKITFFSKMIFLPNSILIPPNIAGYITCGI